ncbi:alpha-mannosidase [Streptomyces sp. SPB78]|uniref:alpha-mannosidase n=1 Tax=Streptomyces sp. (strain SPB78) TaxID=591157 RepID=UPI0001B55ED8|nr:glycoside hydrolase family 38 C-terminal domain-containing protein [Streptomyces sp. SPB78]EFL02120.1 alpha-mannosidase [Streptomyces sp. SPB78]
MHDDRTATEDRIARFVSSRLRPALHSEPLPLSLEVWRVPGEPVPVAEALRATYEPFEAGAYWGPAWGTTWLRAKGTVPAHWAGRRVEAVFDLDFDLTQGPGGQAEGFVHTATGEPLQGLHPYHRTVRLAEPATGGEEIDLLVELAANPKIAGSAGIGMRYSSLRTAGDDPLYRLLVADLAVREEDVWHLLQDMSVLDELMRQLPESAPRRWEILRALDKVVDVVDPWDAAATAARGREVLADVLARPAHASAHTVHAVGHAHIDSAWLWPLRETVRKCARTFTNVTALAEEYPELVFACSSAQQYAWMKERRPDVYARIRKAVDEGSFVPVGGMWVEADGNLPGGEALARQLVYGRRFFAEEFGVEQDGVWLPDSFGYGAAYPQLAKLAGARWFLTQKLSWNAVNRLPHHTFDWEGIDGTRILTHFPPVDTYNCELTGRELAHAEANFAEKGVAGRSLAPFGFGDGGGGPTREMMERARRLRDLEGSPRVEVTKPSDFFATADREYPDRPVWRGELYLENHRGTYTSQARTKRGNRRAEALLREAELWAATAAVRGGHAYPYEELEALWRRVLLHQFHDILPGTSIAWVHEQAEEMYREAHAALEGIIGAAASELGASGEGFAVLNAAPQERTEVVVVPCGVAGGQELADGSRAVLAHAPALGAGTLDGGGDGPQPVTAGEENGDLVLDNGLVRVRIDRAEGLVRSVRDLGADRETLAPDEPGNLLQLHHDDPTLWSAWNLDASYRNTVRDLTGAESVELVEPGPLLARVRVTRAFGASRLVQDLELTAGARRLVVRTDIDWQERDAVLKAAWPLDVHAGHESAEVQFGHVQRPTHENTSWDAARFEVWQHRWVHVGEHGFGAALLTDSTYGHDVRRHTRADGGTTTTLRLSLLRAPHSPDPEADRGRHTFAYALEAGADIGGAAAGGYALNLPLRVVPGGAGAPLVTVSHPDVLVEAVKLADDRSGDVVVRLYESRGGAVRASLGAGFAVGSAAVTDLLEEPVSELEVVEGRVALALRPFQILTVRLRRS